jgi:hypothetical protein
MVCILSGDVEEGLEEDFGCEPELRRSVGELVDLFDLLSGERRHPNLS